MLAKPICGSNPRVLEMRSQADSHLVLSWRLWATGAVVAAIATTVVFVWPRPFSDEGGTLKGPPPQPFALRYPSAWEVVKGDQLQSLSGRPLAVLHKKGGRASIVIFREGPVTQSLRRLAHDLARTLKKRSKGFQQLSSRIVKVHAGRALYYSYLVSRKPNIVNSIMLVPAGRRSYLIKVQAARGDKTAGGEIGKILSSFDA